jgi:hypothetical protein
MGIAVVVPQQINLDNVRTAHSILHRGGQQVEIRVPIDGGGALSGRFDDERKMLHWLTEVDGPDVIVAWWTIQELKPEPATNDLQRRRGSGNESVAVRYWIFIDVDPVRDIDPASDEELGAAESKYNEALRWLCERGIEPSLTAMSGNGFHLYIAVDGWPNDKEHNDLVKAFIGVLDARFSDDRVKIDIVTANPGRLAKIPGTVSRKGQPTDARPHRLSRVLLSNAVTPYTTSTIQALVEVEGPIQQPKSLAPPKPLKKNGGSPPKIRSVPFGSPWREHGRARV